MMTTFLSLPLIHCCARTAHLSREANPSSDVQNNNKHFASRETECPDKSFLAFRLFRKKSKFNLKKEKGKSGNFHGFLMKDSVRRRPSLKEYVDRIRANSSMSCRSLKVVALRWIAMISSFQIVIRLNRGLWLALRDDFPMIQENDPVTDVAHQAKTVRYNNHCTRSLYHRKDFFL